MGRVVHFEIHAAEPERAAKFYSEVFGWKVEEWKGPADYWLVMTGESGSELMGKQGDGIDGAIMKRLGDNPDFEAELPVIGYVCTVDVEDLDETMKKAKKAGARIVREKTEVPGVGWMCYAKDTEGNIFGMMEPMTEARWA